MNPFQSLFVWLEHSAAGDLMRSSVYTVPITLIFHLVGLILLGGVALILSLSLAGVLTRDPAPEVVARELRAFHWLGLFLAFASGLLLIASNGEYYYFNTILRVKMLLLAIAVAFSSGLQRRVVRGARPLTRGAAGFLGGFNLLLWISVGVAGRAIGLL